MAWKVEKHLCGCNKPEKFSATFLLAVVIDKDGNVLEGVTSIDGDVRKLEPYETVECAGCGAVAHWEDDPEPIESDEDIDVIASGYEWTCPGCGDLRKEIGIKPRVVCKKCNLSYAVSDYKHSVE